MRLFHLPLGGKQKGWLTIVSCTSVVYHALRLLSNVQADNGDFILVVAWEQGICKFGIPGKMEFTGFGVVLFVYRRGKLQDAPGDVYLAVI